MLIIKSFKKSVKYQINTPGIRRSQKAMDALEEGEVDIVLSHLVLRRLLIMTLLQPNH